MKNNKPYNLKIWIRPLVAKRLLNFQLIITCNHLDKESLFTDGVDSCTWIIRINAENKFFPIK